VCGGVLQGLRLAIQYFREELLMVQPSQTVWLKPFNL
jgi:hypothetical protein